MLISLVADCHVGDRPEDTNGVDTKANFGKVIARLRERSPDHVVLMGDYSVKAPRSKDVEWVGSRAVLAEAPLCALAGNHDDAVQVAAAMKQTKNLVGGKLYYRQDLGTDRALFLDTSAGFMSAEQIDWLRLEIRAAKTRALVFMHHPPMPMGVPFMDDHHALKDAGGTVYDALFSGPVPVHVFAGHFHTARSTQVGIHAVHLCPSTYFQLDPTREDFAVSHSLPGIRHVELMEEQVRTWVEFVR